MAPSLVGLSSFVGKSGFSVTSSEGESSRTSSECEIKVILVVVKVSPFPTGSLTSSSKAMQPDM
jgi:hypothetical protein